MVLSDFIDNIATTSKEFFDMLQNMSFLGKISKSVMLENERAAQKHGVQCGCGVSVKLV